MLITRWQAPLVPTKEQVLLLFEAEGLEAAEETYQVESKIKEHRHPFNEVRVILNGEMFFNIGGTQFVLRAGDRVEIPANTRHSFHAQGNQHCTTICAFRHF